MITFVNKNVSGNMVSAKKPAPDIYDYALKKLGLPAAQCIAIEDSYNGIRVSLRRKCAHADYGE